MSTLSFIWPIMLVLLVLIPLSIFAYLRLHQRRQMMATRFSSLGLNVSGLPSTNKAGLNVRRHLIAVLFLISLFILVIALARPSAVVSLPHVEGTVILAFDVSGSMAADDFKPTRMEAAKTAATEFINRQPINVQIGVVAFSDNGFSIQVPTNDHDAVLAAVNRLEPQKGTSLANGILVALNTLLAQPNQRFYSNLTPTPAPSPTPAPKGSYTAGTIVLLTDGENNESPDPMSAAQTALDRGVKINTIGIGSTAGTNLHINGFNIHTQLNEAQLQQISQLTGGNYYNADNEQDLRNIYDNLSPQVIIKTEKTEITSILVGASLFFLLIGSGLSLMWFSRLP